MMSPSDPSRTTRKRCSGMRRLAYGFEKFARRMILRIAHNRYTNAEPHGRWALRDALGGVIRPFGMNVRTQILQKRFYIRLAEAQDIIHGTQCADQGSASRFGQNGASGAF